MVIMKNWFLRHLSIMLTLIISIVHTKHLCSARAGGLVKSTSHGGCDIQELWITHYSQLEAKLRTYNTYSNVYICGVIGPLAKTYLSNQNILGSKSEILFHLFHHAYVELSVELTAGAVSMAITEFCATRKNLDLTFVLVHMNDECTSHIGVQNTAELLDLGVDVIFGSPCSPVTKNIGLYLNTYGTPILSTSSSDNILSDKDSYNTLLRIGITYKQAGAAFLEFCRRAQWNTVAMVIQTGGGVCALGGGVIRKDFEEASDIMLAGYYSVHPETTDGEFLAILQLVRTITRVIIVCLHSSQFNTFMNLVDAQGMNTEEYVYITYQIAPSLSTLVPWGNTEGMDSASVDELRQRYKRLKIFTSKGVEEDEQDTIDLMNRIREKTAGIPWYFDYLDQLGVTTSIFSLYMYDSVWLYLSLLDELINDGITYPRNGTLIYRRSRNYIFQGKSGVVYMDSFGDRIAEYWMWQLKANATQFTRFLNISMASTAGKKLKFFEPAVWYTENGKVPLNVPSCGYKGEICRAQEKIAILVGGMIPLVVIISVFAVGILLYRKNKFQRDLKKIWKIDCDYIFNPALNKTLSKFSLASTTKYAASNTSGRKRRITEVSTFRSEAGDSDNRICNYQGTTCFVKEIKRESCRLNRNKLTTMQITELKELKERKEMKHENITVFVGACVEDPFIYLLTEFCDKGSLCDVLENEEIELDWSFKYCLISDLAQGIQFIHDSIFVSHGHITSKNCYINSRWSLQIGKVGLHSLRDSNLAGQQHEEQKYYRGLLWTAPEILRMAGFQRPLSGTKKGDIYSFAIVMQEILCRAAPFYKELETLQPRDIVDEVKHCDSEPLRPEISFEEGLLMNDMVQQMIKLMRSCWKENPEERPSISQVNKKILKINNKKKFNMLDNILLKLEKYSSNLEKVVVDRTDDLMTEKVKIEDVLHRMLPTVITEQLKKGVAVTAEMFDSVTVYFSDIVEFTPLASESTPIQVVDLLNDLYTTFDEVVEKHDAYKMETIGDAYMVVSGCPVANDKRHVFDIANMSLALRSRIKRFKIKHLPNKPLAMRMGFHTGPCAAGVVGVKVPKYTVFGETVNIASLMESSGESMKIQVSEDSFKLLRKTDDYVLTERIPAKAIIEGRKGFKTYWINGY